MVTVMVMLVVVSIAQLFCQANPVMVVMMMIMVSNPVMVDAHSQHDTSETHV